MGSDCKHRMYIVSFGDSDKYKVEFEDKDNVDPYHHTNPLDHIEKELKDYLDKLFPGQPNAFLTTPKVTEVECDHKDQYAQYKPLDASAVEEIKKILKRGMEMRDADRDLDSNAPYAQISR